MSRPTVGGIRRGQRWRNNQSGSASARWHNDSLRNNVLFSSRGSSTTPTSVPPALDMTDLHSAIKDRKENFLMVTGAPGSGKTTRVPLCVEEICGSGGLVIVPKRLMATQSWSRLIRMGTCTGCEAGVDIGGAKGIGTKITFMTIDQSINPSINQSVNLSISRSIHQVVSQPDIQRAKSYYFTGSFISMTLL
jgi:HrpA-like RNA helicase